MPEELDDREENEYGNEQEYDNGRKKEVRDYAKRQMERAEQRINILFSEEQKELVLEYAAMTGMIMISGKWSETLQTLSVPRMKRR